MDLLAAVTESTQDLAEIEAKYLDAMRTRNEAIRAARAERHGPAAIGKAADLTPEQVRRIYNAPSATPGKATRPARRV